MGDKVIVHKDRTNTIQVHLGFSVAGETITSQIRSQPTSESPLIAAWTVTFLTDGTDGKLVLKLDNSITQDISANTGYMDLKRTVSGEPISIFDEPLEVVFRGVVTV